MISYHINEYGNPTTVCKFRVTKKIKVSGTILDLDIFVGSNSCDLCEYNISNNREECTVECQLDKENN